MRIFLLAISVLWITFGSASAQEAGRINVTGEGVVDAAPDMATINLAVSNEARSAAAALSENSATTSALLAQIQSMGIENRDMQTSGLSLSPVWDNRNANGTRPGIVGYGARNQVAVRVRDLNALGAILDQVVKNGANEFNGLVFGLQQPGALVDRARQKAVVDAKRKAELYAAAAGVELGKIVDLSENGSFAPQPTMMREMAMSDAVPIAQGEVSLRASVSVVFEIAQ